MIRGKGQSILGFIFAFIAIAALAVGLIRIWIWFSANYAHRQISYQQSRQYAATPGKYTGSYSTLPGSQSYIDLTGEDTTAGGAKYLPLNLTEDWVFSGNATGQKVATFSGTGGGSTHTSDCKADYSDKTTYPECFDYNTEKGEYEFNYTCAVYLKCQCNNSISPQKNAYEGSIKSLRENAIAMQSNASSMRDAADDCDDPWEICWWGNWGKTTDELRKAAGELEKAADKLVVEAADMEQKVNDWEKCCNDPLGSGEVTEKAQEGCMKMLGSSSCQDIINSLTEGWSLGLTELYAKKAFSETTISNINSMLTTCANEAESYCSEYCTDYADDMCVECTSAEWDKYYNSCYPGCYSNARSECCKEYTCCADSAGTTIYACGKESDFSYGTCLSYLSAWNRDCDTPSTNCDETCSNPASCAKCGLSALANNIQTKIDNEITPDITKYEHAIGDSMSCCTEYSDIYGQWNCIAAAFPDS